MAVAKKRAAAQPEGAAGHASTPAQGVGGHLFTDALQQRYPKLFQVLSFHDYFTMGLAEQFPGVLDRIELAWGAPRAETLLKSLMLSERSGRQGFPDLVLRELGFLRDLLESGQEQNKSATQGIDTFASIDDGRLIPPGDFRLSALKPGAATPPRGGVAASVKAVPKTPTWPVLTTVEAIAEALKHRHGSGKRKLLGEILVACEVASREQIDFALALQAQQKPKVPIGRILKSQIRIPDVAVTKALCIQAQIPLTDPAAILPGPDCLKLVSLDEAREHGAFPLFVNERAICLAVPDPFGFEVGNYFKFLTGRQIALVHGEPERIQQAFELAHRSLHQGRGLESWIGAANGKHGDAGGKEQEGEDTESGSTFTEEIELPDDIVDQNDSSVIGLVNRVLSDAIREGASDIHIEVFPRAKNGQIRFRRDGMMSSYSDIPLAYYPAVISRIKIMSNLDISERRRPQDGRLTYMHGRVRQDFRVASLPTSAGLEAMVLRLLANAGALTLEQVGLPNEILVPFKRLLSRPHGLILVCGPTGSGKTTTLHAALKYLNTPHRKILTAEDPVEITQPNITQVPVNRKIGLDFATALRAFLRADPDVIMIGEMRDLETAAIGVESSMTGHLVLSTLHTNSSAETVARVLDMGIDPFNFADALQGVLSQRLARKLCAACKELHVPDSTELEALADEYHHATSSQTPSRRDREALVRQWTSTYGGIQNIPMHSARGCDTCQGTGYKGRLGFYEFLCTDVGNMRTLIRERAPSDQIQACAMQHGMRLLKHDGIEKVLAGLTSLEEVRAACA